ncbi:hypothetical protein [Nocardia brasiliensis]|uniref:hypothetical protein n=1 Tax=Nocardia brasiliensis TaxID=37326 RepID=UPI0024575266|nr:hypothetical protein [Nocardia brasiliensis]
MAETLPTRPGIYRDVRKDLWTFDGETFRHIARWMERGPMWPVRDHPGISAELMAGAAGHPPPPPTPPPAPPPAPPRRSGQLFR